MLDPPMADRICVGYLLCRVADTIEDAGHIPPAEQATLLDQYQAVLDPEVESTIDEFSDAADQWLPPVAERSDDWQVVANADRVVGAFEELEPAPRRAIREPTRELVGGMATFVRRYADAGGLRIQSIEELEEYCWYAAGTVGELVTNLLERDATPEQQETLRENARSFALLLQLVNVAKDVRPDYREENNVYLPDEWLAEAGVEQSAVADPDNAGAVGSVVDRVVDRATGYVEDAQTYLESMPETQGNNLGAWAIPHLLAVGTIRELRARPQDVLLEGNVKVPRAEVATLMARFEAGVSRDELKDLSQTIERTPLHET